MMKNSSKNAWPDAACEKEKKRKGTGRPSVPAHLKRNRMTGVRIQQWLLERLMQYPGSKGQLIERLLIEEFGWEYEENNLTNIPQK